MRQLTDHLFAETSYQWLTWGLRSQTRDHSHPLPGSPPGMPSLAGSGPEIESLGIRYLISTDFHGDHVTGAAFIEGVTFITPQLVYQEITRVKGKHPFSKRIFVESLRDQGHPDEAAEIAAAPSRFRRSVSRRALSFIFLLSPLRFAASEATHLPAALSTCRKRGCSSGATW